MIETNVMTAWLTASQHCDLIIQPITVATRIETVARDGIVCNKNLTELVETLSQQTMLMNTAVQRYVVVRRAKLERQQVNKRIIAA